MQRWAHGVGDLLRLVVFPCAGLWGALFDRPLDVWNTSLYLILMGLAPASILDGARPGGRPKPKPKPRKPSPP